jgi:hypothetical protein
MNSLFLISVYCITNFSLYNEISSAGDLMIDQVFFCLKRGVGGSPVETEGGVELSVPREFPRKLQLLYPPKLKVKTARLSPRISLKLGT